MLKRRVYAGLDLGSSSCEAVVMDANGVILDRLKFSTSEYELRRRFEALRPLGEVHVHLEVCELAAWARDTLRRIGHHVVVGDPKLNAWIAKDARKSDRIDAFKLAELLRVDRVHPVYYPDDDRRAQFKQLVQHYDDLTSEEVRLKLKIKARFRSQGIIVKSKGIYDKQRTVYLAQVRSRLLRESIEELYQLLDHTLEAQAQARERMKQASKRFPEVAEFDKVPGIGVVHACVFSAYIQTPHRFSSKRKLWRYCRLGITDRSSDGKPLGRRCLDRSGNARLKDLSRQAFLAAMRRRDQNRFKRAYERSLQRTANRDHARLSTQRLILATLRAMWLTGEGYRDDDEMIRAEAH